jgi:hypothetical protein
MGSNSSSNAGNSGSDAFVNKKSKVKPVKRDKFGYTVKENPVKKFISGGGIIGAVTKPFREKTEAANRKFYEEKVVPAGKIKKGTTYESYMKARLAGKTDAYGNPISQGDNGGGNQVVQASPVATIMPVGTPTEVEISQSEATEAKEDDILLRKRKAKARGRSPTIMTGVTGATGSLTLGKPSLLGS